MATRSCARREKASIIVIALSSRKADREDPSLTLEAARSTELALTLSTINLALITSLFIGSLPLPALCAPLPRGTLIRNRQLRERVDEYAHERKERARVALSESVYFSAKVSVALGGKKFCQGHGAESAGIRADADPNSLESAF